MNSFASSSARLLNAVYFGGNWTSVDVFSMMKDLQISELNFHYNGHHSLLELFYHQYYFVTAIRMVLKGEALTTKDKNSFDAPVISSENDWINFQEMIRTTVHETVTLIENCDDRNLLEPFSDPNYGSVFSNIHGIIEHVHYHLGQISILKKLIRLQSLQIPV